MHDREKRTECVILSDVRLCSTKMAAPNKSNQTEFSSRQWHFSLTITEMMKCFGGKSTEKKTERVSDEERTEKDSIQYH